MLREIIRIIYLVTLATMIFTFVACGSKTTIKTEEKSVSSTTSNSSLEKNKKLLVIGEWPPFTSEQLEGKGFLPRWCR